MNKNIEKELVKIFENNKDKRICVIGTTCTGKSHLINKLNIGEDMDDILFPLLTKQEIEYVCQDPWTKEIGQYMDNLAKKKIKIKPGNPVFSTVLLECNLLIYLHINDELLKERTRLRNANYANAKNMQEKIEEEIKNTNIETITLEV